MICYDVMSLGADAEKEDLARKAQALSLDNPCMGKNRDNIYHWF